MLPRLWGSGKFESVDAASLEYIRGLGVDYIWYTGLIRHATRKKDEGCLIWQRIPMPGWKNSFNW